LPWTVQYLSATKKQLRRLDPTVRKRIFDYVDVRVAGAADPYADGEALTRLWRGHWRYRVGDYRVICRLQNSQLTVMVVRVGHRRDVYDRPLDFQVIEDKK
jgi:mRNA interferase RelE/StbE